MLVNIISNAVKYTDRGGKIDVTVKSKGERIVFSVSDNGIGIDIDKTEQPHIFEHLYRTDISRARDTGGSGIGLAVVNAIISAHKGSIEVTSDVGIGSIFTVTLPTK